MSAYPVTDTIYPATYFRRFTSFASQLVLHADASSSGSAPTDVNHLPSKLIVEVTTADTHLDVKDVTGTTAAINFDAVGTFVFDSFAPASIETTTNVAAVTVCWNQK